MWTQEFSDTSNRANQFIGCEENAREFSAFCKIARQRHLAFILLFVVIFVLLIENSITLFSVYFCNREAK
jgi:hypothetical protein